MGEACNDAGYGESVAEHYAIAFCDIQEEFISSLVHRDRWNGAPTDSSHSEIGQKTEAHVKRKCKAQKHIVRAGRGTRPLRSFYCTIS